VCIYIYIYIYNERRTSFYLEIPSVVGVVYIYIYRCIYTYIRTPNNILSRTETSIFKVSSIDNDLVPSFRQDINGYSATKVVNKYGPKQSWFQYCLHWGRTGCVNWAILDGRRRRDLIIEGDNIGVVHSFNSSICCIDSFEIKERYFALNEIDSTWTLTNNGYHAAKVLRVFNSNISSMTSLFDAIETLPEDVINSMVYEKRFRFRSYFVTSKWVQFNLFNYLLVLNQKNNQWFESIDCNFYIFVILLTKSDNYQDRNWYKINQ
jgi:hypothetical protein